MSIFTSKKWYSRIKIRISPIEKIYLQFYFLFLARDSTTSKEFNFIHWFIPMETLLYELKHLHSKSYEKFKYWRLNPKTAVVHICTYETKINKNFKVKHGSNFIHISHPVSPFCFSSNKLIPLLYNIHVKNTHINVRKM